MQAKHVIFGLGLGLKPNRYVYAVLTIIYHIHKPFTQVQYKAKKDNDIQTIITD